MKNFWIFPVFFCFFASQTFAIQNEFPFFLDVPATHKNFNAIDRLQKEGIISGYADGTFQPEKTVSRAEALKILLNGAKISVPKTATENPLPDVPKSEWFAPFVAEAKKKGIVNGNKDGNFLPANTVNNAEALKMLLLVNKVEVETEKVVEKNPYADIAKEEWFAPFFEDAKYRGIFAFAENTNVEPGKQLTRGDLAEMVYRFIRHEERKTIDRIGAASWYSVKKTSEDEKKFSAAHRTLPKGSRWKISNVDNGKSVIVEIDDRGPFLPNRILDISKDAFEAIAPLGQGLAYVSMSEVSANTETGMVVSPEKTVSPKAIATNFFEGITLSKPFVPLVHEREIFVFSGKTTASEVTIFYTDTNGKNHQFYGKTTNGNFEIPVFFDTAGKVNLGVLAGKEGSSKVVSIEISGNRKSFWDTTENANAVKNFTLEKTISGTKAKWEANGNDVFFLSFWQKEKVKTLFVNGKNEVLLPHTLFDGFENGVIFAMISGSVSADGTSFALQKPFGGSATKVMPVSLSFPEFVNDDEVKITKFSGEYEKEIFLEVENRGQKTFHKKAFVLFPSGKIEEMDLNISGKKASLSFVPKEKGGYVVEILDSNALALVVQHAIPKGFFPVLPHEKDLYSPRKLQNPEAEIINRINIFRSRNGLSPLKKSDALSDLAKIRNEDMDKRNYLSHYTPAGKNANDIRLDLGISTSVSENISLGSDAMELEFLLESSPSHRKNLLNPESSTVGISVVERADKSLLLTQIFSVPEITPEKIAEMEKKFATLSSVETDEILQKAATQWTSVMKEKKNADFSYASGESIEKVLDNFKITTNIRSFVGLYPSVSGLLVEMEKKENGNFADLFLGKAKKMGVNIQKSPEGILFLTVLIEE